MALIEYSGVNVCHDEKVVLEDVNLSVKEGEFVYLVGRVGSGKTSLLKTVYGELSAKKHEDYQSPVATVMDFDLFCVSRNQIQDLRRQMGIVFQDFQLLTDRNVHDNLDFVLRATGWKDKEERQERIVEVLQMVGMEEKIDSMPYELSGGQQQCVCIARALLNSPRLILADEATGNLDQETGLRAASLLYNISREQGTAVIMSTHNKALMQEFPGRVVRCEDGHLIEE